MKPKTDSLAQARFLFHQGTNYYAYNYLGVSTQSENEDFIYTFRTWAPNAESVALVSDFTGWKTPLELKNDGFGVWEISYISPKKLDGAMYKYLIRKNGEEHLKGDPYANFSKGGADGASIIFTSDFRWEDDSYKSADINKSNNFLNIPINIYEVHLASFLKTKDNEYLSYREIADLLVPYVKYMGFTHIELMPLSEYPYDGSWGYQVGAFYAPTSRFGTPDDLRYLINKCHTSGIGVILDWVCAHFPKDDWGLFEFDGIPLYEYQGIDRQESATWKTRFFDVGREEVQSFLISNALYYFREFHVDGLRVDAVASMLYLDYDKSVENFIKNHYGGRENLEAIAFFRKLNERVFYEFPNALMIAEESGDYGKITHPITDGGLGFNLKWNMGWANDFYDYLKTDPFFRKFKHSALTFPLVYAFSERYILPISHDEVVHGKLSLINKCYGSYEDKFKQTRSALLLMMTYPGKKHLFMGTEFAQFREWDYQNSLEWFMLDYTKHRAMRDYVCALNKFYMEHNELWEYDFSWKGFKWILSDEAEKNLVVFKRYSSDDELTVIISFSGADQSVSFELESKNAPKCIFTTEECEIKENIELYESGDKYFTKLSIPSFVGRIYKCTKNKKEIL